MVKWSSYKEKNYLQFGHDNLSRVCAAHCFVFGKGSPRAICQCPEMLPVHFKKEQKQKLETYASFRKKWLWLFETFSHSIKIYTSAGIIEMHLLFFRATTIMKVLKMFFSPQ